MARKGVKVRWLEILRVEFGYTVYHIEMDGKNVSIIWNKNTAQHDLTFNAFNTFNITTNIIYSDMWPFVITICH